MNCIMPKEIYLSGLTADQLSEMIRESLRDELQQFRPARPKSETKYLTRQETARRLRISLVTLTDWVNRGKICAHKIGGRVLFRDSDVEAALNQIVPIKNR
ncbi:helix-turn-helix domain-containing protein [Gallalistipes aquisgranensis]|uniref:helix-turn-helix domain-containing protein n=1 Tax=Gallalistipes aquisgranensis TaxID=2779358 RepID=UPI00293B936C|nr:helix-turn-helix domain-containing protein [Gallalistipes aquisgranensis]